MQHAIERLPDLRRAVLSGEPGADALLRDLKVRVIVSA